MLFPIKIHYKNYIFRRSLFQYREKISVLVASGSDACDSNVTSSYNPDIFFVFTSGKQ